MKVSNSNMLSTSSSTSKMSKCLTTCNNLRSAGLTTTSTSDDSNNSCSLCCHGYAYAVILFLSLQLLMLPNIVNSITNAPNSGNVNIEANSNVPQVAQVATVMDYSNPHFKTERRSSTIVQMFEWKFLDIAAECTNFLGPKGYAGIQLSPVTEHLIVRTDQVQRPWWERYQPISYKIATRSGGEEEFLKMSRDCNAAGVRVYVDVVLNHMAGSYDTAIAAGISPAVGTAGSVANVSTMEYSGVSFSRKDFHKPCTLTNYMDAYEVRNCQLNGQPDLDHSRLGVRARIVELLNKLIDMGAAGFRIDAAKYMWPIDIKLIFNDVKNLSANEEFYLPENVRPFVYHDVCDLGIDSISKTEYSTYGLVTEYLYAAELSTILSGKVPLSSLINWGPAMGFLAHQDALVFVDSHDGQRGIRNGLGNNRLLTHKQRHKYVVANAFMLAHPYGRIKRIMSSYHYMRDNVDQGPPVMKEENNADDVDDDDSIRSPPEYNDDDAAAAHCTHESGWVCEHRWPAIANMITLVNSLCDEQDTVINFQTDGPNHIAFCRGHKAFIAINNDAELDYVTEVHTCLGEGIYCDVISGGRTEDGMNCHGRSLIVNAEGNANIMLSAVEVNDDYNDEEDVANDVNQADEFGVIAVYVGSRLESGADGAGAGVAEIVTEIMLVENAADEQIAVDDVEVFDDNAVEEVASEIDEDEAAAVAEEIEDAIDDDGTAAVSDVLK